MKLIFGTRNAHKFNEARELVPPYITLVSPEEAGLEGEAEESGQTFRDNALLKADYIFRSCSMNCFAEDSGLVVPAIDGEPGIRSARYAVDSNPDQNQDKRNVIKLLSRMQGEANRNAWFIAVICLILNGEIHYFEGKVNGRISTEPSGNNGFGYDPIFIPDGHTNTFAEMTSEEKNNISHRKIALKHMCNFLVSRLP